MPELHLDYAFLRRADSDVFVKLLITKTVPNRAMRAMVVPSKGAADAATAERVFRGVREIGIRPPCVVKYDGGPAVEALREELV